VTRAAFRIAALLACSLVPGRTGAAGETLDVPDVALTDSAGRVRHLRSELIGDRVVALQFVFTSCATVCPAMGAQFRRVQELSPSARLISVSIDPGTDTPARMAAWGERYGAGPSWTLLTGDRDEVIRLQKSLGVFAAEPASHTPTVVVLDGASGRFARVSALAPPQAVADAMARVASASDPEKPSARYFRGLTLTDQDGRRVDLYRDLMAGRAVVVQTFFTTCRGVCPATTRSFRALQERFTGRLGGDLLLLSITVAPGDDTPERLRAYAREVGAASGWRFLTGSADEVDAALRRFGQATATPEGHSNVFLAGNDRTGLWKKLLGLAPPGEIGDAVARVLDDPE
jgi:cytochrome oxidase Cu insertion factor (SCO1/SenC/PrrC family)